MTTPIIFSTLSYQGWIRFELLNLALEAGRSGLEVIPYFVEHTPTPVARNRIVAVAQQHKANILMFDSDCVPMPNTFPELAKKVEEEVCVACCPYVSAFGTVCVGEQTLSIKQVQDKGAWERVTNCGTHCIAYNVKVFDAIEKPYFEYYYNEDHSQLRGGAEDTVCHRKLVKAGIPIWCHFGLWAGHQIQKNMGKPRAIDRQTLCLLQATCE